SWPYATQIRIWGNRSEWRYFEVWRCDAQDHTYQAALALLTRTKRWSALKAWGVRVAKRRGLRRAVVAVARKLAIVMHRIWADGSEFRWTREEATA
ncbi:hypothetical protein ABIB92_007860, partial [Bradyrhizobium sp. JR5.3]